MSIEPPSPSRPRALAATPPMALALLALVGGGAALAGTLPIAGTVPVPASSVHRDSDDLLTAGLGLEGLRGPIPALADPAAPTFAELRRRAVWTNWRGIADVSAAGGLGTTYGDLRPVPGREFHGRATVPGAAHPHRVLLQLPDTFDRERPCLVVTASSGSRGVYGAIALAGGWGLPKGCAVAYTDKGAGTDWTRLPVEGREDAVHVPHAHSGDHPEADWGRHVLQAAAFGRDVLVREAAIHPDALRVIAAGVSNGAGAVLRAAGDEADASRRIADAPRIDGVVAVSPNIHLDGARPLFDVATHAALLMPCALAAPHFDGDALLRPGGTLPPAYAAGCATLAKHGQIDGDGLPAQATAAWNAMQAAGWTDAALRAGGLSVAFDLWRAVAAGYASAYARAPADAMPLGYRYAVRDAQGAPVAATPAEAALWWSDSSGIPPGNGVVLLDPPGDDGRVAGLLGLRALAKDDAAVRDAIIATRALPPRDGLPILLLHGLDDGLVPEWTTSAPYAAFARQHGARLGYWRIAFAQHFDAFLGMPGLTGRYVPLMPEAYAALDAMLSHLRDGAALPGDRTIGVPAP
ncbi:D-(-)-3-hydroxybutyrate oligomer hydrolase [Silanimonas algicola]